MVKKLIALLACFCFALPVSAQQSTPGLGWSTSGTQVSSDQPFLMTSNQPGASQERALDVASPQLTKTDNGANSTFVIGLGPVLSYWYSTGATTQQAAANAVLDFPSKAAGDLFYYNGTNVVRLPKGANSTVVGVDSGGTFGYYSPGGSGTVTNFILGSWPSWYTPSVTLSTSTPTLAVAMTSGLTANQVLATPNSVTGAVGLRSLVAGDIPNISAAKITSGNLAKAQHATTAVFNDQANTYTGTFTQNFGASTQTLVIPVKASGTTTGEIALNSTDLEFRSAGVTNKAAKQATTISTTSPLSGGGDLSANRTLTLGTVDTSKGGTGLTSFTAGDTLYYASGTTLSKVAIGASGTVWKSNGTAPTWGTVGGSFGGDGSAGAVTKGAVTETTQLQLNATTFSQTVSTTWAPLSGTIVNATSTITHSGTTNVGAGNPGGKYGGAGIGGGMVHAGLGGSAGSGGGYNGGASGDTGANASIGVSTHPGMPALNFGLRPGGSGGSGGVATSPGGTGGGLLVECAVGAWSNSGTINLNGGAGSNAGGSTDYVGAGGGAGGTFYAGSQTSCTNTGTISAVGGAGGNGAGTYATGGPGGGGGWIVFHSPSNTNGTRTLTGGAAGTGSSGMTAGGAGQAVSLTGTPNLPLFTSMQSDNFARMKSIALAHKVLNFPSKEGFDVELTQREAAQACSRGSVIQFAKLVDGNMEESTCIEIGDHVKGLDNAS